jgi:CHAT domain-containing protein/tetratricopeptide (TPR) repeat protein
MFGIGLAMAAVLGSSTWLALRQTPAGGPSAPYTPAHQDLLSLVGPGDVSTGRLASTSERSEAQVESAAAVRAFGDDSFAARAAVESLIEQDLGEERNAPALAASGVRRLLSGDCDRSIAALEEALELAPSDPRILNDLAVAHSTCAEQTGGARPLDVLKAVGYATRAARDGGPEAAYTLASALDSLHLRRPAREEWARYLEVDRSPSPWANHAKRRLEALSRPTVREAWEGIRGDLLSMASAGDTEVVRTLAERYAVQIQREAEQWLTGLLPSAVLDGEVARAAELAAALQVVGRALGPDRGGHPLLAATVELAPGAVTARELARSYRELGMALEALERLDGTAAYPPAERASLSMTRAGAAYAGRAGYVVAACLYMGGAYDEARGAATSSLEAARAARDPVAEGRSLELLGLVDSIDGRLGSAVRRMEAAREVYRRARWPGRVAAAEGGIAEVLGLVGDEQRAWRYLLSSLGGIESVSRSYVRLRVWTQALEAARLRYPEVASRFADAALESVAGEPHPLLQSTAWLRHARAREGRGDLQGALQDLEEANEWFGQIPDGDPSKDVTLRSLLEAEAGFLIATDPQRARPLLDRVAELDRETENHAGAPEIEWLRGRLDRALGERTQARERFESAVDGLGRHAASVESLLDRVQFQVQWRELHDDAVGFLAELGDPGAALEIAERSRWIAGARRAPDDATPEALAARLPVEAAVVAYRVLPERLLIWLLRRGGTTIEEIPVPAAELSAEIDRARHAARWGDRPERAFDTLYDRLVRPVAADLGGVEEIVFVPDSVLDRVPFSALRDRETGRYLVQDAVISASPSVGFATASLVERGKVPTSPAPKILAVSQARPRFPRGLEPLPLADTEIERIGRRFPRSTVRLIGPAATPDAVLVALADADVFHFSGHAMSSPDDPFASSLVLASAGDGDPLLPAHRFLDRDLSHLDAAVLAGCSSGGGGTRATDLAAALLAAGAPVVIASLWDVGDHPTAELVDRLYAALAAGEDPVSALHRAQMELLASADPELARPSTWASFQVYRAPSRQESF